MDDDLLESLIFEAAQHAVRAETTSARVTAEIAMRLRGSAPAIALDMDMVTDDEDDIYRIMADALVESFVADAMTEIASSAEAGNN